LIKTGSRFPSGIHKLINSIWNKEDLAEEWKESVLFVYKKGDKTDAEAFHFCQLRTKFIQNPAVKGNAIYRRNY